MWCSLLGSKLKHCMLQANNYIGYMLRVSKLVNILYKLSNCFMKKMLKTCVIEIAYS